LERRAGATPGWATTPARREPTPEPKEKREKEKVGIFHGIIILMFMA
jgi:hypothetical protein